MNYPIIGKRLSTVSVLAQKLQHANMDLESSTIREAYELTKSYSLTHESANEFSAKLRANLSVQLLLFNDNTLIIEENMFSIFDHLYKKIPYKS